MVSEKEVEDIAKLADITLPKGEIGLFTTQFNAILEYFDILDAVVGEEEGHSDLINVLREDEILPSLDQAEVLANPGAEEDGFIKAPRVM